MRGSRPGVVALLLIGALLLGGAGAAPPGARAATGSSGGLGVSVSGSPFYPNGDGRREKVTVTITLAEQATLRVDVLDFDGALVKTLRPEQLRAAGTHVWKWNGRAADGTVVPDGPYFVRAGAQAAGGPAEPWVVDVWFTKARNVIYKPRPGAIVVAVDPGHGDVYSEGGRYAPDGTHESVINLDIGLRLRRMLEGAGVGTVITRTVAGPVNNPEWDRTGDGETGYLDELAARADVANMGRADLYISIHNNLANNPKVGGPSTWYRPERPHGALSLVLARAVQNNMLARLDLYATESWRPSRSHGVLSSYPYYVLSGYTLPDRPRPTQMPAVLSEGMFLTHPYELSLLKQPRVRQSMAAAYYDAIRTYLQKRTYGAGYEVVAEPTAAAPGAALDYSIRVTNKGQVSASGWVLEARAVPAVLLYDGSGSAGKLIGSTPVPRLGLGDQSTIALPAVAPAAGDWLVKFDIRLADGSYLSPRGVPVLQLPLSVTAQH